MNTTGAGRRWSETDRSRDGGVWIAVLVALGLGVAVCGFLFNAFNKAVSWKCAQVVQPEFRGGEARPAYSKGQLMAFSSTLGQSVESAFGRKATGKSPGIAWIKPKPDQWIVTSVIRELPDASFVLEIDAHQYADQHRRKSWVFKFANEAGFRAEVAKCGEQIAAELASIGEPGSAASASGAM